jgi:CRP-like cAMP-binding protein
MTKSEKNFPLSLTNIDDVFRILNEISIFGGLSEGQVRELYKLLKRVKYGRDDIIFAQGDEPGHIYIILSGRVKIVMESPEGALELVVFGAGHCFGETSAIAIEPHSASAIVIEDTELLVLSRKALLSIFESDKELFSLLILNIAREACRRLHKTSEILLHYVHSNHGK